MSTDFSNGNCVLKYKLSILISNKIGLKIAKKAKREKGKENLKYLIKNSIIQVC